MPEQAQATLEQLSINAIRCLSAYGVQQANDNDSKMPIKGSADIAFTEDRGKRFEACGWYIQNVADGLDAALWARRSRWPKRSLRSWAPRSTTSSP